MTRSFVENLASLETSVYMAPRSITSLEVWRLAICAVKDVYGLTRGWPREELYGLTSQARRAAISVPANIAEGAGRKGPGDVARFVQIALGSLYELDTLVEIATELSYTRAEEIESLRERLTILTRKTTHLIKYQPSKRGIAH
jgi:four helix bundle protein